MLVDINADLTRKVKAIAELSDQTFDRVVNALLSNAVESILPIQALRFGPSIPPSGGAQESPKRDHSSGRGQLARQIRDYVLKHLVEPARARGETEIVVRSGDVHRSLDLRNRLPAVCAVLGSQIFRDLAKVQPVSVSGPANGATTEFRFGIVK
jgi:hypothetical protein